MNSRSLLLSLPLFLVGCVATEARPFPARTVGTSIGDMAVAASFRDRQKYERSGIRLGGSVGRYLGRNLFRR